VKRPRVLLADDHNLVLEGIRKLLESHCDLVGSVEDGRALVGAAIRLKPDVVLLDISMPLLNGIEAARQLKQQVPGAKLVFVTMHADPSYVTEAFHAGASGYVIKRSAACELIAAIDEVLRGRTYVTPLLRAPPGCHSDAERPSGDLTDRQREVLQLVAEGHSAKEIAAILDISIKTVEFHKSNLRQRLALRSTAELTRHAIRRGLIER
jgi:DNA-binding NarL/FixJ family response regulator